MYKEIQWKDFERFMREKGFIRVYPYGWSEIAFGKFFTEKERMILVGTTFDNDNQREKGTDAIRVQLRHGNGSDEKMNQKIIWTMSHTKRMPNWKGRSGRKIEIMEEVVELTKRCPSCGRWMFPKMRKSGWIFWSCFNYQNCKNKLSGLPRHLRRALRAYSDNWGLEINKIPIKLPPQGELSP